MIDSAFSTFDLRRDLATARLVSLPWASLEQEIDIAASGTMLAVRERRAWLVERTFGSCGPADVRTGQFRLYRVERLQACATATPLASVIERSSSFPYR